MLGFTANVRPASAATLFLTPASGEFPIGQSFDVELRVDSQGEGFNAAQATIQFPIDILQIKSVDFSSAGSIFNFWLQPPTYSNTTGRITFIGGNTSGLVGSSVGILKLSFYAHAAGTASVSISDSAVTASDGSGTNILTSVQSAQFSVSPTQVNPPHASGTPPVGTTPTVMPPTPIVRKPVLVKKLPEAPKLLVPFYPDQTKWYNSLANFLVQWELPMDISGVSTILNKNSKFTPVNKSEGLFDTKAFPSLTDGVWYLHVQFQNNVGWGPVTDYRLAIDTAPPLSFTIDFTQAADSPDPTRTFNFKTSDGLSGLDYYLVRLDNGDEIKTSSSTITTPAQRPGQHEITVKAVDAAGNVRENSLTYAINPIESPRINFVDQNVFTGISDIHTSGSAISHGTVVLELKDSNNMIIAETGAQANDKGEWVTKFNGPFKIGRYYIEATAQNSQGAWSLPVKSGLISVRVKPLFTIGSLEISQTWFFIIIIIILIGGFLAGWLTHRLWHEQITRKTILAQRDTHNVFASCEHKIDEMLENYKDGVIDEKDAAEMKFLLLDMKKKIKDTERYVIDGINDISR